MAKRISNKKIQKLVDIKAELERTELEYQQELENENRLINKISTAIDEMCNEEEIFCGVIITKDDLLRIIEAMINNNAPVKIPYTLYFNE